MPPIDEILASMRDGATQSDEAIAAFVQGVTDATVSRPQAAAWLAWAFQRGLTDAETIAFTRAMTESGDTLSWPAGTTLIDKHSTGGVGDKVSLILAPLWVELGMRVPMVSGRGLGHTGGTLDKLEGIEGYRCDLSVHELERALADAGCFISGQTGEIAPADRVLYALRNETQTVASIPLIVGSILSKKLAEGLDELVLDVKTGSGAFMAAEDDAVVLGETMVRVASGYGVRCRALVTSMERPLGNKIGNSLEVEESIQCLRGEGPDDLHDLVVALAGHDDADAVLRSGRALDRFYAMCQAQGADMDALTAGRLRGSGCETFDVTAGQSGVLLRQDALSMGRAAFVLGAGRLRAEDPVDHGVGIVLRAKPGDDIQDGDVLATLLHRDGRGLDEALAWVAAALDIGDGPAEVPPLVRRVL